MWRSLSVFLSITVIQADKISEKVFYHPIYQGLIRFHWQSSWVFYFCFSCWGFFCVFCNFVGKKNDKLLVSGDLNIMYNGMERKLHSSSVQAQGRADNDDLMQPHLHEWMNINIYTFIWSLWFIHNTHKEIMTNTSACYESRFHRWFSADKLLTMNLMLFSEDTLGCQLCFKLGFHLK